MSHALWNSSSSGYFPIFLALFFCVIYDDILLPVCFTLAHIAPLQCWRERVVVKFSGTESKPEKIKEKGDT